MHLKYLVICMVESFIHMFWQKNVVLKYIFNQTRQNYNVVNYQMRIHGGWSSDKMDTEFCRVKKNQVIEKYIT